MQNICSTSHLYFEFKQLQTQLNLESILVANVLDRWFVPLLDAAVAATLEGGKINV